MDEHPAPQAGPSAAPADTASALRALRAALEATVLPLQLEEAESARTSRRAVIRQIDDYIAPRVENLDAPLLAVVGGSTGAGKSTLVNSLVGRPVTRTGAIRPTTRQPILLHSPSDRGWFASTRVLPGLARISADTADTGDTADAADATARGQGPAPLPAHRAGADPDPAPISSVQLRADPAVPDHLAILDAPDVDSIAEENRALAAQLLAAADLWLFVTTANRYADAVPWTLLDDAASRDITVAVVLDRIPPGAAEEISHDLGDLLARRGLAQAPLFTLEETALDELGMLPSQATAQIRDWLDDLAQDRAARQELARRTVQGAISRAAASARAVAAQRAAQTELAASLREATRREYDRALGEIIDSTRDGTLLRGEVLARWQDFVGTSDVFRTVESWLGRMRDRAGAFLGGRTAPVREVEQEIEHGLHAVIVDQAQRAASAAHAHLTQSAAARGLAEDPALGRESPHLSEDASALIRAWQASLTETIRDQAGGKRARARVLSLGLNAVTVALMVVVFASTGGLTGGEIAIAGGSAVVGQKLLETIFGEDAVRRMAREAREDLQGRLEELLEGEHQRYEQRLAAVDEGPDSQELIAAAERVEQAAASDAASGPASTQHPEGQA